MDNPRCFFDIEIGNEKAGRIVVELRADIVPKVYILQTQHAVYANSCTFMAFMLFFVCRQQRTFVNYARARRALENLGRSCGSREASSTGSFQRYWCCIC